MLKLYSHYPPELRDDYEDHAIGNDLRNWTKEGDWYYEEGFEDEKEFFPTKHFLSEKAACKVIGIETLFPESEKVVLVKHTTKQGYTYTWDSMLFGYTFIDCAGYFCYNCGERIEGEAFYESLFEQKGTLCTDCAEVVELGSLI